MCASSARYPRFFVHLEREPICVRLCRDITYFLPPPAHPHLLIVIIFQYVFSCGEREKEEKQLNSSECRAWLLKRGDKNDVFKNDKTNMYENKYYCRHHSSTILWHSDSLWKSPDGLPVGPKYLEFEAYRSVLY